MRPLRITDASSVIGLQQEIQRSEESRYDHRLHGVLLVAQGMTCPEVARLLGDAPRSVEYWVHRFEMLEAPSDGATLAPAPFVNFSPRLFLSSIILERSSPSRVRFAAPNNGAPLTAPGRSEETHS